MDALLIPLRVLGKELETRRSTETCRILVIDNFRGEHVRFDHEREGIAIGIIGRKHDQPFQLAWIARIHPDRKRRWRRRSQTSRRLLPVE